MRSLPLLLLVRLVLLAGSAAASPPIDSAEVLDRGTFELAVVQPSRVGLGHGLQLSARLPLIGVMPHAALTWQSVRRDQWSMATRLQLTYPSLLMSVLAREGAGGLMPPDTTPAQTLMIDARQVVSRRFHDVGTLSLGLGLEVAPRAKNAGSQPILDFPFLYPRFAAMHGSHTLRMHSSWSGSLPRGFGYAADAVYFHIPAVDGGFAVELGGQLSYRVGRHFLVDLGMRASRARLPVGLRWHMLPWIDLRFPFLRD